MKQVNLTIKSDQLLAALNGALQYVRDTESHREVS